MPWYRFFIIFGLIFTLISSHHNISLYLEQQFSAQAIPVESRAFTFALKHYHPQALLLAAQHAEKGSEPWLHYQSLLAQHSAKQALELAQYWQNIADKKAQFWYQQGFSLEPSLVVTPYLEWLLQRQRWSEAGQVFSTLSLPQMVQLSLTERYLHLLIRQGDLTKLTALVTDASFEQQSSWQALNSQYQILPTSQAEKAMVSCKNSIQPIATNLDDLAYWQQLEQQFSSKPLASFVCFNKIRYLPLQPMNCNVNARNQTLRCDLTQVTEQLSQFDSRYLLMLLPQGGANTQWGVTYLDRDDSVDVLQHEILHLLGFVDEYPLAKGHSFCQNTEQVSVNVVRLAKFYQNDDANTKQQILAQLPWRNQLGEKAVSLVKTTEGFVLQYSTTDANDIRPSDNQKQRTPATLGLYPVATCEHNEPLSHERGKQQTMTVKAIAEPTVMAQNQALLPSAYLQLLAQHQARLKQPSFHYAVAFQLFIKQQPKLAEQWLTLAASYESIKERQTAIAKGDFDSILTTTRFTH